MSFLNSLQSSQLNEEDIFIGQLLNWLVKPGNEIYVESFEKYVSGLFMNNQETLQRTRELMRNVGQNHSSRDFSQSCDTNQNQYSSLFQPNVNSSQSQSQSQSQSPIFECDSHSDCERTHGDGALCNDREFKQHPQLGYIYGGSCERCPLGSPLDWVEGALKSEGGEYGHNNRCLQLYANSNPGNDCQLNGYSFNPPPHHKAEICDSYFYNSVGVNCCVND